jgi:hypothetical protein
MTPGLLDRATPGFRRGYYDGTQNKSRQQHESGTFIWRDTGTRSARTCCVAT